ncbi:putative DNA-binding domain-containing protein [Neptuniibacter sp. CAU 1671]|uniref:HvfC family RiPP maturation protein n=1 Tax=Neptuniibacter sp. CAU 1671 TaxID=3032593 RepID=UPI0023DB84EA|nr:putative DNA-binding domain-containing protein [Neptuniibacter sp. CAU 1671]MDF2181460.1 putative DNA-binding domain-containing protein [Neptuniibacter sp. CAU 1671]
MQKPSPDLPRFQQLQYAFAGHIRDPEVAAIPDAIEPRRMKIYSELFFNNVEGMLANNFPVLRSLLSEPDWLALIRAFFVNHHCKTPYFLELGQELMAFMEAHPALHPEGMPFLLELMHYEWVELALDISQETLPLNDVDANGDLLSAHPVQSPLAWLLSYQYPVHQISRDFQPQEPTATPSFLLVYRNREDRVKFMEVNPVTGRLLYLLSEDEQLSGLAALEQIAAEMQHPSPEVVIQGGLQTLEQLRSAGIVLGTRI